MRFWVPKYLIKKWITIAGRKIPIINRLLARRQAMRVFQSLGVSVGPATQRELNYCTEVLKRASPIGLEAFGKLSPAKRVSSMKLLQVSQALVRCEQLFPGIAKGLKLRFFSIPMDLSGLTVMSRRLSSRIALDSIDLARMHPFLSARVMRKNTLKTHRVIRQLAREVGEGTILLNASSWARGLGNVGERLGFAGTTAHEVGHILYSKISKEAYFRWREIFRSYFQGVLRGRSFYTQYSVTNASEGFAEAFAGYVMRDPHLKERWPEAWEFFDWLRTKWAI